MLRTKELVPEIYYNQSRDFQFIGRLFDIVFNYSKNNIDLMSNDDVKLLNLLARTLGFETKHQYNTEDLQAICNVFIDLVRAKGSYESIKNACKTLISVQNISGYLDVVDDKDENGNKLYTLSIYIPGELTDLILLEDLFNYILPAGYDYNFIKSLKANPNTSDFGVSSRVKTFKLDNENLSKIAEPTTRDSRPDMVNESNSEEFGTTYTTEVYKPVEN